MTNLYQKILKGLSEKIITKLNLPPNTKTKKYLEWFFFKFIPPIFSLAIFIATFISLKMLYNKEGLEMILILAITIYITRNLFN